MNGLAFFLDVLVAQRQLFDAELGLAATQRAQLVAFVQVYKALGGGWTAPRRGERGGGDRAARLRRLPSRRG